MKFVIIHSWYNFMNKKNTFSMIRPPCYR